MTEAQVIWEYRQIVKAENEKAKAQNPNAMTFEEEYKDPTYVAGDPGEIVEIDYSGLSYSSNSK
ncbi:hypothetical protein [Leptothoe spongobia]|uniref:Uncharacterized protein n=1 Tax=Leptothoe spongobia TAU-MAC 1115 TaxID=1967444 RepID=A0A947DG83_9CYAN|nr:hypothetical protein [Leptothoe spongobia]MBT9316291.1 hypothetical protein [Leptothoe spongobia TAU-MAC 1115]